MADEKKEMLENALANEQTENDAPAKDETSVTDAKAKSDKAVKPEKKQAKKEKKARMKRVGDFFRNYKSELKKIAWPTFRANTKTTVYVIVTLAICAVIVGVFDLAFNKGILWLGTVI